MQNIGGPGKKLSDVEVKEFLERQRYNTKQVVREVFEDEIMPQLNERFDEVLNASATAHKEIIKRLERLENQ
ncbi:MAG: hypothetical protein OXI34_03125 [Chloroflexota bacterium]|nr:hypothetical protein [Chloroflexota bacterium]MDE2947807.1 hypothetical protein [Chloroflexota bacterium]